MKIWIIKSAGKIVAITSQYELVEAMTGQLEEFELTVCENTKSVRWAIDDGLCDNKIEVRQAFN